MAFLVLVLGHTRFISSTWRRLMPSRRSAYWSVPVARIETMAGNQCGRRRWTPGTLVGDSPSIPRLLPGQADLRRLHPPTAKG
jgi:hypothetical protein